MTRDQIQISIDNAMRMFSHEIFLSACELRSELSRIAGSSDDARNHLEVLSETMEADLVLTFTEALAKAREQKP